MQSQPCNTARCLGLFDAVAPEYLRQARATVASPMPRCLPSSREDQCVTPSLAGGGSSVVAMIAASSTVVGRPDRSSSANPAKPCATNQSRHLITVGRETPTYQATVDVPAPPATANTIRARSARPADSVRDLVHDANVVRSSSLGSSTGDGIPHRPTPSTK